MRPSPDTGSDALHPARLRPEREGVAPRPDDGIDGRRGHGRSRLVAALVGVGTFLGAAYPPVVSFYGRGLPAIFEFFAGDAFYYLAVAENSLGKPFYTFDGAFPTNGFHPLWQYYLRAAFELMGWQGDQASQLLFAFFSGVGFVAAGTALFALTLLRLTGRPVLSVLGVLPGATYFLVALIDPKYGAPWSFVNGMESALTVLLGGGMAYLLVGQGIWARMTLTRVGAVSLLATLLTLSRLDDVFLFVPLLLGVLAYAPDRAARLRGFAVAAAIPAVGIGAYLLYNLATVGVALPMSGLAKAQTSYGGLALPENLADVLRLAVPSADGSWAGATWRVLLMVAPVVVATAWLAYRTVAEPGGGRGLTGEAAVSLLAVYVVAKGLYNLVNVRIWDQGHWYYPLSVFTANLILALFLHRALRTERPSLRRRLTLDLARLRPYAPALGRLLRGGLAVAGLTCVAVGVGYLLRESANPVLLGRYSPKRFVGAVGLLGVGVGLGWLAARGERLGERLSGRALGWRASLPLNLRPLTPALALLALAFTATMFVNQKRGEDVGSTYAFWRDREAIAARLEGAGGVVEYDDGILSYALPGGAMSGLGLALDPEAFAAWNRAELLNVAYARGYRLIGTGWYQRRWPEEAFADPAALERSLASFVGPHALAKWTFRPFYVERGGDHSFAFLEFAPKPAP